MNKKRLLTVMVPLLLCAVIGCIILVFNKGKSYDDYVSTEWESYKHNSNVEGSEYGFKSVSTDKCLDDIFKSEGTAEFSIFYTSENNIRTMYYVLCGKSIWYIIEDSGGSYCEKELYMTMEEVLDAIKELEE